MALQLDQRSSYPPLGRYPRGQHSLQRVAAFTSTRHRGLRNSRRAVLQTPSSRPPTSELARKASEIPFSRSKLRVRRSVRNRNLCTSFTVSSSFDAGPRPSEPGASRHDSQLTKLVQHGTSTRTPPQPF